MSGLKSLNYYTEGKDRLAGLGEITVHIGAPVNFPPNTPGEEIARQLQLMVSSL